MFAAKAPGRQDSQPDRPARNPHERCDSVAPDRLSPDISPSCRRSGRVKVSRFFPPQAPAFRDLGNCQALHAIRDTTVYSCHHRRGRRRHHHLHPHRLHGSARNGRAKHGSGLKRHLRCRAQGFGSRPSPCASLTIRQGIQTIAGLVISRWRRPRNARLEQGGAGHGL